jgi:hypothetical protein
MVFGKPINQLELSDIKELVNNKILESLNLDYKLELGSTKDLAKDVSSFANERGGWLVYGVKANKRDVPTRIVPLESTPGLKEKVEQQIMNAVSPRPYVEMKLIQATPEDRCVLVIYVPQSSMLHQVTIRGDLRYYRRRNFMSVPMNEREILERYTLLERASEQAEKRLAKMERYWEGRQGCQLGVLSVPTTPNPGLISIGPETKEFLNPNDLQSIRHFPKPRQGGYSATNDLDLFEIDRDGSIAWGEIHPTELGAVYLFNWLGRILMDLGRIYEKFSYLGPVRIRLKVWEAKGLILTWRRIASVGHSEPLGTSTLEIDRDLHSDELGSLPYKVLKEFLDEVFQAFGLDGAFFLDKDGKPQKSIFER